MEENQNQGDQITRHLLAREIQHTDKVRVEDHLADGGEEKYESYVSSVTGVLLFSCFIAVCGSLNYGLAVGYSSPVESEILDDLGLSTAEYSLFGSILTIGGALGAIACGEMSDYLGRRGTFGVADVLSVTGWVAIVASQGVLPLYLGRLLLGIALGITSYVVPVYIAEIAPRDVRGGFVILHMVMSCAGIAIAYILGALISWRVLAAVGIFPNLTQLICLFFIPESPRWLVKAHKVNKLKATLQRLRGSNANISVEAADIKEYTEALEQSSKASIFELFQWKYAYTLTVGIGLFALSKLVGSNAIVYYASSIFESAGFSSTVGSIVMALVMVLSVSISSLLTDRFGRRPLLMVSASGICLGCLLASISFVFEDHGWLEGFSPYLALIGLTVGYSSPVESEILDDLGLSTAEYSLFGSILTIGGALGAIACGEMSDYLGRRGTFGVADVLSVTGWVAIVASQGVLPLYLGRLLLGIALGITSYVVPVYIAEIAPRDVRGGFVILHMVMSCAGIAIAYILGALISWRVLAAVGIFPNLTQLICLFFIPESPRWLVKAHKVNKLKATLQRLRGSNANISVEAADIKEYTEALEQSSKASIFELFQWKYAYTLTVGIGLFALSKLVGSNAIVYYASSIFESAGFSSTVGSIVMALVMVLSVSISSLLTDRFGRRPLLMVSASGICLGCLLASISFVFEDHGWLEGFSPYLALIGLTIYCAFYVIGIGGISFLLISEIYPISIKGLAGSLATFVGWVTSWFVAYAFNFSMEWSSAGTFFILTGMCAFTLLFVVKLVPETKGRTLEEIQASVNQIFRSDHGNQP